MNRQKQIRVVSRRAIVAGTLIMLAIAPGPIGMPSLLDSGALKTKAKARAPYSLLAQTREEVSRPRSDRRRDRQDRDSRVSRDPVDPPPPPPPSTSSNLIKVEFKLDPRISQSHYMGDRWVSPRTYTRVEPGTSVTIEGRAFLHEASGARTNMIPEWTTSDPLMVTIEVRQGNEVALTVNRTGESRLQVSSQGETKWLLVKATYDGAAIRVDITQE